jgi:undecaprenyl-diphosphatase
MVRAGLVGPVLALDLAATRLLERLIGRWWVVDAAMAASARHIAAIEVALLALLAIGGPGSAGRRRRGAAVRTGVGLILAVVGVDLAGRLVKRSRPFAARGDADGLVPHRPDRSFPSRHAACAAAMATVVLPSDPFIGRAIAGLGVLLSLSRVYAGLHYPSDVVAGWLIGLAAGLLAAGGQHAVRSVGVVRR